MTQGQATYKDRLPTFSLVSVVCVMGGGGEGGGVWVGVRVRGVRLCEILYRLYYLMDMCCVAGYIYRWVVIMHRITG